METKPHPPCPYPDVPSAEKHAHNFKRVRDAHRREIVEDYVEMIAELARVQDDVRTSHLAERFGVSNATVTNRVQRLVGDGLIEDAPYQPLVLTEKGRTIAQESRRRHVLVRDFLIALGVDPDIAEADTEGIEHHVSEETLAAFARFVDRGSAATETTAI
ncbi:manganese-binding transcriptional regulator MntR [Pontibaca salina]|uniref:Transcriptional regulator MntR n=1 Tax=Pontibaca salina TaxID=2795731 RepID=A0A934HKY3_9RHOB|nr:manganese-binding transcriptional regulator MntR [Pontibaca salina]MBI6630094.1 manganese-binding transcriptional regulator MntR [Pontibaca salina]